MMRCDQLAKMAAAHLGHRYSFEVCKIPPPNRNAARRAFLRDAEGAVLIFLKQAASGLEPEEQTKLKARARGICIDHVDANVSGASIPFGDIHIAASVTGYVALRKIIDEQGAASAAIARMLTHHADPRLAPVSRYRDRTLSVGYFGAASNTSIPTSLRDIVRAPPFRPGRGVPDILGAMRRSNLHYAVRPRPAREGRQAFKPFTKGFNAAMANANIIVNRDADDALEHLGGDYPFLIPSDSPGDIAEGMRHARDVFGCAEWREGLDRMAEVRAHCAPARIMGQLRGILDLFN